MITINTKTRDFDEVETYLMTIDPAIKSIKEVPDNTTIIVSGVMEFTDSKHDGTSSDIMSIITPDMEVYACQSKTFKNAIHDISNIMHGKDFPIRKISGVTKSGREYVNAVLDVKTFKEMTV